MPVGFPVFGTAGRTAPGIAAPCAGITGCLHMHSVFHIHNVFRAHQKFFQDPLPSVEIPHPVLVNDQPVISGIHDPAETVAGAKLPGLLDLTA